MQSWKKIDKERLTVFTDAIIAIIMTILVLDLKVPDLAADTDENLAAALIHQIPHFLGFVTSFSMIIVIWFSHHSLIRSLREANAFFTVLNFLFVGSVATLPFSTALVSEFPSRSLAVFLLAANMFLMNLFLTAMFSYMYKKNLYIPDVVPKWYTNIKRNMGIAGIAFFVLSMIVCWFSPFMALLLIIAVPLMHCVPLPEKKSK